MSNKPKTALDRAQDIAGEIYEETPVRCWVEGDGRIYGDFASKRGQRSRLTELDIIKALHKVNNLANAILSLPPDPNENKEQ